MRARYLRIAAGVLVLAAGYLFFAAMVRLEPITGDGWSVCLDIKRNGLSPARLFARMQAYHRTGNPRLGQLFTYLSYGAPWFHHFATPLVLGTWPLLAFVHATGRRPRLSEWRDTALLVFVFAASWLVVPSPGQIFFYRPIVTNYTYSAVFILAVLLPMRLDLQLRSTRAATALACVLFVAAVGVGKLNEHTGPALVLVAAMSVAVALRRRDYRDVLWRAAAALGLLVGFLLLFFAPGQRVRYGALGQQSVFETIAKRGVFGTLHLLGQICDTLAPLLCAMVLLGAVFVLIPSAAAPDKRGAREAAPLHWPGVYVLVALIMFGTAFAAPKNLYRLFITPSLLLAVAATAAVDRAWVHRGVRWVAGVGALVVHLAFMALMLDVHGDIDAAWQRRLARIAEAGPGGVATVKRLPRHRGDPYFFGDSIAKDPRHRRYLARYYGLKELKLERKPKRSSKKK